MLLNSDYLKGHIRPFNWVELAKEEQSNCKGEYIP